MLMLCLVHSFAAGWCMRRDPENYELIRKVGRGKYSEVF